MSLQKLGWDSFFQEQILSLTFKSNLQSARIVSQHRTHYAIHDGSDTLRGDLSGKFRFDENDPLKIPAVGDWVLFERLIGEQRAVIHKLFSRKTCFVRKQAGETSEPQIVAANIDKVFIVVALNHDFNAGRVDRYLSLAWESGAVPVLILSKADLAGDIEPFLEALGPVVSAIPVIPVSTVTGQGISEVLALLSPQTTVVFMGSSGVGKSSLVNVLFGSEIQKVDAISEHEDKGKHTTTHRQLFSTPNGCLIDTPGMRELQLFSVADGVSRNFSDIEELKSQCQFSNCTHQTEPACAVLSAIDAGELSPSRWKSFLKLAREAAFVEQKQSKQKLNNAKKVWKQRTMDGRKMAKATRVF